MNFLDIAVGKDITLPQNPEWKYVSLNSNLNLASVAAIVINSDNSQDLALVKELQDSSGLKPPIIQVIPNKLEKNINSIFTQATNYHDQMVPQYLRDLIHFATDRPVSFTTPGHHNGQYYDKHPAGVVFNRFFGKNLMYADTSDTVPELGDMMMHDGSPLTAEKQAALTYKADKVYFCTNGTTSANSICASALLTDDDLVLFDRNNHKS